MLTCACCFTQRPHKRITAHAYAARDQHFEGACPGSAQPALEVSAAGVVAAVQALMQESAQVEQELRALLEDASAAVPNPYPTHAMDRAPPMLTPGTQWTAPRREFYGSDLYALARRKRLRHLHLRLVALWSAPTGIPYLRAVIRTWEPCNAADAPIGRPQAEVTVADTANTPTALILITSQETDFDTWAASLTPALRRRTLAYGELYARNIQQTEK